MIILIQASFEQRDLENPRKGFSSHYYRCIQSNQTNTGTPGLNLSFSLSSSTPIPSLHPSPYLGTPQPTNHTPPFLSLSTSPSRWPTDCPLPSSIPTSSPSPRVQHMPSTLPHTFSRNTTCNKDAVRLTVTWNPITTCPGSTRKRAGLWKHWVRIRPLYSTKGTAKRWGGLDDGMGMETMLSER